MWIEEIKKGSCYAFAKVTLDSKEVARISNMLYEKLKAQSNKESDYSKGLAELQLQFSMLHDILTCGVVSDVVAKKYGDLKIGKGRELK